MLKCYNLQLVNGKVRGRQQEKHRGIFSLSFSLSFRTAHLNMPEPNSQEKLVTIQSAECVLYFTFVVLLFV